MIAVDHIFVERVFHVRRAISSAEETRAVGLVFRKKQLGLAGAQEPAFPVLPVLQFDASASRNAGGFARDRTAKILAPRPSVAKPDLRQDVQRRRFRPTVHGSDSNENVFDVGLRVLHEKIEITVFRKDSRVEQFEFRLATAAALALLYQGFVRKRRLRIFVEHAHVAVRGRGIEIEVVFLHVLTVIALISREAEKPLFQNGVASVP